MAASLRGRSGLSLRSDPAVLHHDQGVCAMRTLDWIVLVCWLFFTVCFGLYRARGSSTMRQILLAGKTIPWYSWELSILAPQPRAITSISPTTHPTTSE